MNTVGVTAIFFPASFPPVMNRNSRLKLPPDPPSFIVVSTSLSAGHQTGSETALLLGCPSLCPRTIAMISAGARPE